MKRLQHLQCAILLVREQRLRKILLQLAYKLTKLGLCSIRTEQRIAHKVLAAMFDTTSPRVSTFMRRFLSWG